MFPYLPVSGVKWSCSCDGLVPFTLWDSCIDWNRAIKWRVTQARCGAIRQTASVHLCPSKRLWFQRRCDSIVPPFGIDSYRGSENVFHNFQRFADLRSQRCVWIHRILHGDCFARHSQCVKSAGRIRKIARFNDRTHERGSVSHLRMNCLFTSTNKKSQGRCVA
jgi:hypothetical protein